MNFSFYAYDLNRNLSMIVTPKGAQIKLYNNPANLVAKKFLPEGVVDYTYDAEYNLTNISDSSSTLTFTYDPLSRLTQAQTAGTVQQATSISYAYDLNSNLTNMTDPAGDGYWGRSSVRGCCRTPQLMIYKLVGKNTCQ